MSEPLNASAPPLLEALRAGLPIAQHPYADLGARAGMSEADTLATLRSLKEQRVLRRIGARFSPGALGYEAALGAFEIPEDRVEEATAALTALPNVTHVFEAEDRYRLWFTLVVPSQTRLEIAESEIARAVGASDRYRVLPAELHKVTASFDLEGAPEPVGPTRDGRVRASLDRDEKALVRLLQGELPLTERPFSELAHTLAECGYDVDERWTLDTLRAFAADGVVTGLAATLRTRREPWRLAIAVWGCPHDPAAAGELISSFPEVLHCFERRVPGIGNTVIALIEAPDRAEVDRTIVRIDAAGALEAPRLAFPLREYSRAPMRYFTDGD